MRCNSCDGPCLIFQGKYWKCEHCDELYEITEQLNDDSVQLVKIITNDHIESPDWQVNLNDKEASLNDCE